MMKKFFAILFTATVILLSCSASFGVAAKEIDMARLRGTEINVYNWGEYISDGSEGTLDVNKQFEQETGIKVNYTTYDSNENMYNKIKGGGASYDIVIPSDYMIERLINEELLEKINFDNIPNYKNIMPKYKDLYYDPSNEYSVPYNVGMVGLVYNTKMVDERPDSWEIMWDEKYKGQILMFNNSRDAFGIAQFLLGIDVNTTDSLDWDAAFEKLKKQKPLVQSYVMDDVFNKMEGGEAAIAAYYAGDCISMADNNPDLDFVYPKEGTNIFVDSICIPKSCQNKEAAEVYINFLLRGDIALANAEFICYATPNQAVIDNEEYSLRDNKMLYPDEEDTPPTEYFHNLDADTLELMTSLWDYVKIEGNNDTSVYVGLISFTVLVIAYAIYRTVRKKKRESMY